MCVCVCVCVCLRLRAGDRMDLTEPKERFMSRTQSVLTLDWEAVIVPRAYGKTRLVMDSIYSWLFIAKK